MPALLLAFLLEPMQYRTLVVLPGDLFSHLPALTPPLMPSPLNVTS